MPMPKANPDHDECGAVQTHVAINGHQIPAVHRTALLEGDDYLQEVFLLRGSDFANLPDTVQIELRTLSDTIPWYIADGHSLKGQIQKQAIFPYLDGQITPKLLQSVTVQNGPLLVGKVGSEKGRSIYIPLPLPRRIPPREAPPTNTPTLATASAYTRLLLARRCKPILNDHLNEICNDLLRLFTSGNKSGAGEGLRNIQLKLGKSIKAKLQLAKPRDGLPPGEQQAARELASSHAETLQTTSVATHVVEAAISSLLYNLGLNSHRQKQRSINTAKKQLARMKTDSSEAKYLNDCINLLHTDNDQVRCNHHGQGHLARWPQQLRHFCRFVLHMNRELSRWQGRSHTLIFLSHHMRTMHSMLFVERLERSSDIDESRTDSEKHRFCFFREHAHDINLAIRALMWIADRWCIFIPNSLDTEYGPRVARSDKDWVIEELIYGHSIGLTLHYIVSRPLGEKICGTLASTIENYRSLIGAQHSQTEQQKQESMTELARSFTKGLNTQTNVPYDPPDSFTDDFLAKISQRLIRPTAVQKFATLIANIRGIVGARAWLLMASLHKCWEEPCIFPNKGWTPAEIIRQSRNLAANGYGHKLTSREVRALARRFRHIQLTLPQGDIPLLPVHTKPTVLEYSLPQYLAGFAQQYGVADQRELLKTLQEALL